ncbi:MAG: ATP-dependent Clp protease ATP-binding subunit [bacterium]|nr:ATP-dependent Clp protease ATP-binding subunit [bacterium]
MAKEQKIILDAPPPPSSSVKFDDPNFYFSAIERKVVRGGFVAAFCFFAVVAVSLLFSGFPRQIFDPRYVFSFSFPANALKDLFGPEISLGMLFALFFVHEIFERKHGMRSLIAFRRSKKPLPKNAAIFLHPLSIAFLGRVCCAMRGKDLDALIPIMLREAMAHKRIQKALGYLEIDVTSFAKDLETLQGLMDDTFEKEKSFSPRNEFFQRLLRESLLESLNLGHEYVMPEDIVLSTLDEEIPALKTFLQRWSVHQDDLRGIVYALDASSRHFLRRGSRSIKHRVMNRAWTARPTYHLDQYAQDLTDLARAGYAGFLVGHREEVGIVLRILNRATKNNVLLVGETGSGKTTIVEHIAWLINREEVPQKLFDKRLVVLDVGLLVAGTKNIGDLHRRVVEVMNDIARAGNIILAIPEIHTLLTTGSGEGISISTVLGPMFSGGAFQVIGLTDAKNYHAVIEPHAEFKNNFDTAEVKEIDEKDALRVLSGRARILEDVEGIAISYPALKKTVELSARYIHDKLFPAKALDLLGEGVELVKRNKKSMLIENDIAALVSERTGIPVSNVTREESKTLLGLNEEIHKHIIDQEEAVNAVADILRQSRAGVRRQNAPVGSFLFIGPTGVGKTECAKALAEVYFKSEKSMVRFDMSEFQTRESVYRLIGSPDGGEPGQLTERMKHNPYSLLLLDEFEKAHANILDIFLQVLDDGRVTDAAGTTIDFTNAIIIATSNAHSLFVLESLRAGKPVSAIAGELKEKLTAYFKPELLNRFDDIIVFKSLSPQDLMQVAQLQLKSLFIQLEKDRGIRLSITSQAVATLSQLGYDPQFGARPLRHVIRKKIRDLVAEEILKNNLVRGDSALIDFQNNSFALIKTV